MRLAFPLLWLVSWVYRLGVALRRGWYAVGLGRIQRVSGIRVISVGNITVGGSGKTPLVAYIINVLLARGHKPAVVSRGYGGSARQGRYLADEPEMLQRCFPGVLVIISPDRGRGIQQARAAGCTHVILDDAFQNLSVHKDIDIVCVNSREAFGNEQLLPAGPLRLPLAWLRRANCIVLTHQGADREGLRKLKARVQTIHRKALLCTAHYSARQVRLCGKPGPLAKTVLQGQDVAVLCGIAFPERLALTVEQLGGRVIERFYFPDHYWFQKSDLGRVAAVCRQRNIAHVVTTAKDEARLCAAGDILDASRAFVVIDVALQMEEHESEFIDKLSGLSAV